jgi:hypothetical protein
MYDQADTPLRPRESAAALDVELQVVSALSRAAARTLLEFSPESADLFKVFLQREIDRLKLSGPGTPDLAVLRLREFLRD